jgi:hypothetical protein
VSLNALLAMNFLIILNNWGPTSLTIFSVINDQLKKEQATMATAIITPTKR